MLWFVMIRNCSLWFVMVHYDYLNSPTAHRFQFDLISECDIVAIINQMANKNSSGIDELSNKLLRSIKNKK